VTGAVTSAGDKHIAVVAPPVAGHFRPLLVLADALVARGYRVTFVHMEDARVLVAGASADFHAVGAARLGPGALDRYVARLARSTGPLGLPAMIRATAAITAALLDELPDALGAIGADAVIAEAAEPAGALAARKLGLPFVTSHTGLPLNRERGVPPPFVGWRYEAGEWAARWNEGGYRVTDRLMRPIDGAVAARAAEWGLDATADGGFSPLLQVAQCAPGLDFPRAELPPSFRYCGPFRAAEADGFVARELEVGDDRPLVFCSLGSLQGDRPRVFAAMARACADVGARAVIGHGGKLSPRAATGLPGDPLVRDFWPQRAVLERCVAAVLHGGFNTVLDALGAGVPMVVSPIAFEQPATAARVAHAGVGLVLKGRLTAGRLRRALRLVIDDPAYARAAGRLGEELAGLGGAERAAALIDEAVRTGRTPAA
jgi:zeaxanthin glucosyltransferase